MVLNETTLATSAVGVLILGAILAVLPAVVLNDTRQLLRARNEMGLKPVYGTLPHRGVSLPAKLRR